MERQIGKGKGDMKGRMEEKVKGSLWRESKCPARDGKGIGRAGRMAVKGEERECENGA